MTRVGVVFGGGHHGHVALAAAGLVLALALTTLTTLTALTSLTTPTTAAASSKRSLKFGAIGDWGDNGPMTKSHVARELARQCASCAFVLLLGDNFYDAGVRDVDDPQFKQKYLDVFTQDELKRTPFFVIAGNHDHYGNASAQVEFTKRDPTKRWTFPSPYYARTVQQNGVKLLLVMLDTWLLVGGDALLAVDRRTGQRRLRSRAALRAAVATLAGQIADAIAAAR